MSVCKWGPGGSRFSLVGGQMTSMYICVDINVYIHITIPHLPAAPPALAWPGQAWAGGALTIMGTRKFVPMGLPHICLSTSGAPRSG